MTEEIKPRFFTIFLQDPDGVDDSIREAARERLEAEGLNLRRQKQLEEGERETITAQVTPVLAHCECVRIAFDAEKRLTPWVAGTNPSGLPELRTVRQLLNDPAGLRAYLDHAIAEREAALEAVKCP